MANQDRSRNFEIGDHVLALNIRPGAKWYNATVTQKLGINVSNVHVHELDVVWKRHASQLLLISKSLEHSSLRESDNTHVALSDSPVVRRSIRSRTLLVRYGFDD